MANQHHHRDLIQDVVRRADDRRRRRTAASRLARLAPWAGAAALGLALAVRFAGAPPALTVGVLVGLALVLVALFVVLCGRRAPDDVRAARVDADAGLAGELRSADWFSRHPDGDEWTEFHMGRAAAHAQAIDVASLYPPVRATRAWGTAVTSVAAALAIVVTTPGPAVDLSAAEGAAAELAGEQLLDELPPELRAQLEALLKQMAEGGDASKVAQASLEELKKLMAEVDPELSAKLAEMLKKAQESGQLAEGAKPPEADADMAKNTSAGLPEDVRWAVDDLAERLANASRDRKTNEENPAASEETGEMGAGSEQAASAEGANAEAQMKMSREAAADPGASKMMMSGAGAMGGDSRPGSGGNSGGKGQNALDPLAIAQALRQELVEASMDTQGKNVEQEDRRRKTEEGEATVGFTRAAPPSNVERSRAQAPPVVPDARRALLFNYFIREK